MVKLDSALFEKLIGGTRARSRCCSKAKTIRYQHFTLKAETKERKAKILETKSEN